MSEPTMDQEFVGEMKRATDAHEARLAAFKDMFRILENVSAERYRLDIEAAKRGLEERRAQTGQPKPEPVAEPVADAEPVAEPVTEFLTPAGLEIALVGDLGHIVAYVRCDGSAWYWMTGPLSNMSGRCSDPWDAVSEVIRQVDKRWLRPLVRMVVSLDDVERRVDLAGEVATWWPSLDATPPYHEATQSGWREAVYAVIRHVAKVAEMRAKPEPRPLVYAVDGATEVWCAECGSTRYIVNGECVACLAAHDEPSEAPDASESVSVRPLPEEQQSDGSWPEVDLFMYAGRDGKCAVAHVFGENGGVWRWRAGDRTGARGDLWDAVHDAYTTHAAGRLVGECRFLVIGPDGAEAICEGSDVSDWTWYPGGKIDERSQPGTPRATITAAVRSVGGEP